MSAKSGKPVKEQNPAGQGSGKQQKPKQGQSEKGGQQQKKQTKGGQPAGGQKKAATQANEDDVKRDQKLQAILLADSFNQTFRPLTLELPKVLLPLVNYPMLDYTIEFLAQNGVQEVVIYSVWQAPMIEKYIASSKWPSLLSVKCVSSNSCTSAGDALRELDSTGIIRSDPFILISGDVISNMDLKKAMDAHRQNRKQDSNCVMTCVLKKFSPLNKGAPKPLLDEFTVAIHAGTNQILFFEDSIMKDEVSLPLELFESNTNDVQFFSNFLDCNVDICSQELLLQFSDNFDYQDIRHDFIRNEVTNFALGKHVYAYPIETEYAARVKDPYSYHLISRDIVRRWVFPFAPDSQLLSAVGSSTVTNQQMKRYVYKSSDGVKISRTAVIEEEVVIDRNSTIGNRTSVNRSIVGKECRVGNQCQITNSHIWNNVVIEDNVKVDSAIIGSGVTIRSGSVIPRGCILSSGIEIGPNSQLKEFSRIVKNSDGAPTSQEFPNGKLWRPTEADNFIHNNEIDLEKAYLASSIGCSEAEIWKESPRSTIPLPLDDDEDDEDYDESIYDAIRMDDNDRRGTAGNDSAKSTVGSSHFDEDEHHLRDPVFCRNITELIMSAVKENQPLDSVLMEVKGLKFAQDKSFGDCLQGVVNGLFTLILEKSTMSQQILQQLKQHIKPGAFVYRAMKSLSQDIRNEIEIISFVEDYALQSTYIQNLFRFVLQIFHSPEGDDAEDDEEDEEIAILSTDAILQWAENRKKLPADNPKGRFVRDSKMEEFLEWLQEEDDDDDDVEGSNSSAEEEDDT